MDYPTCPIADPDALFDPATGVWHLWYQSGRAKEYTSSENRMVIPHAHGSDPNSVNVPDGFLVPVRDRRGYVPAVLGLMHAVKEAAE